MTSHWLAAGLVALGVVTTGLPTDGWAAQGGRVGAPAPAARSAWHSPAISSPRVLPSQPDNGWHGSANAFRFSRFRDRREPAVLLGPGVPWWWGYAPDAPGYYASEPYDYPPDNAPVYGPSGPSYFPFAPFPDRRRALYEPGCRTDTQKVRSKAGDEHTVDVTRCY